MKKYQTRTKKKHILFTKALNSAIDNDLLFIDQEKFHLYINYIKSLIAAGADVNAWRNGSLLLETVNYPSLFELLVSAGANIHVRNNWGCNALSWAVFNANSRNGIQRIINAGAAVNNKNNWGITPLMYAVTAPQRGLPLTDCLEVITILLAAGANPRTKQYSGKTALDCTKNPEVKALLLGN